MRENTLRQGERIIVNWYQDDQFTQRVTLLDFGGDAQDLTGKTVTLLAKLNLADTDPSIELAGSIVGAATNGIVDFDVTTIETAAVRQYYAELSIDEGGESETFMLFTLRVLRGIA